MTLHSAPITFNNYSFDFYVHDPEIDRMVSRKIVKRGPWEPDLSKIWMDAIGKDDIVLDIGANIGWYSKLAKLQGCSVYSYEPDPRNFDILKENCPDSNLFNVALGDNNFKKFLKFNDTGNYGDSQIRNDAGELTVDVVKLDDIFLEDPSKIKAIKIDVQGYEPLVLDGAKNIFSKLPKGCLVLLEFCPSLLEKNGFDINCLNEFLSLFSNSYAMIKDKKITIPQMFEWFSTLEDDNQYYADTVNCI